MAPTVLKVIFEPLQSKLCGFTPDLRCVLLFFVIVTSNAWSGGDDWLFGGGMKFLGPGHVLLESGGGSLCSLSV